MRIKKIVLDPIAGSNFNDVACEAWNMSRKHKATVEFNFNGFTVGIKPKED